MKNLKNAQWIAGVYLMQGLPFALVTGVSAILYKNFGMPNTEIAFYTSLFMLPYIFKFVLAPALEKTASKAFLTFSMQFLIAILLFFLAFSFYFSPFYSGIIFLLLALSSTVHDINSDGLYLEALTYQEQAYWIGIRTFFYQMGKLISQGGLILLVGLFEKWFNKQDTWTLAFLILGVGIFLLAIFDKKKMPAPPEPQLRNNLLDSYQHVLQTFFKLPHLIAGITFLLFFSFPESQLVKIFPLFMLDSATQGGLNLSIDTVGMVYGVFGISSMVAGVVLGGFLLGKYSLKKCLIFFTCIAALGNTSYLLLVFYSSPSLWLVSVCVVVAQMGFGISNGAYMLYLIHLFAKGTYSMSLYAIATAIMLLGMLLAGATSGYLQTWLGYRDFFIFEVFLSVLIIFLAIYQVKKVL